MGKCTRCGKKTEKLVGRRDKGVCEQCALNIDVVMNEAFERVMSGELPYPQKHENGFATVTFHAKDDVVLAAVMHEVEKQEKRWGSAHDDQNTVVDWVNIIDELLEEFESSTILAERMGKLADIAAVCISALRSIERRSSRKEVQ